MIHNNSNRVINNINTIIIEWIFIAIIIIKKVIINNYYYIMNVNIKWMQNED